MPATDWGFAITPAELESWILHHDGALLVLDKPGGVVCHPSKRGPWSSLIGAAREYLGVLTLHMPSRLDRETSGVVVFAKDSATASRMQRAVEARRVSKRYLAILTGELREPVTVDQPLGPAPGAEVVMRQAVVAGGKSAVTHFEPLAAAGGFTLARVTLETGRMHQIRVHAAWLGRHVVGDKLYGPDERYYLEFVRNGFTGAMERELHLPRHALHASEIEFPDYPPFRAPWPADLAAFAMRAGIEADPAPR